MTNWTAAEIEENVLAQFEKHFGEKPEVLASAPGRVNLIGEHTDYNEGFVFPMAIQHRIWAAGRRRADGRIRLVSLNGMPEQELALENLSRKGAWSDYVAGVVLEAQKSGQPVGGFDAVVYGNVPTGSGLSSSAALEVCTLHLLMGLFGFEIEGKDQPLLCHRAETGFVGVNCGVMDQFISALGRKDHALFLDCRSLDYDNIPVRLGDVVVAITDSKVKRGLVDSEYNARRRECEEGVRILQEAGETQVKALRDATPEMLERHRDKFPEVVYRRCLHVVTEDERVLRSVDLFRRGDLEGFGKLLNESHRSLRDNYEVSCPELDTLVETAWNTPGVLGSRLTGAGFGGCTVTLVRRDALENLVEAQTRVYRDRFGKTPEIFVSQPEQGGEHRRVG
ncbi:MAG TPA: galactokinase [Bacteroidetes bacterium]|nr:galactokinase [Bacteroidota bacterium]